MNEANKKKGKVVKTKTEHGKKNAEGAEHKLTSDNDKELNDPANEFRSQSGGPIETSSRNTNESHNYRAGEALHKSNDGKDKEQLFQQQNFKLNMQNWYYGFTSTIGDVAK